MSSVRERQAPNGDLSDQEHEGSRDERLAAKSRLCLQRPRQNELHPAAGFVPPFGDQGWGAVDLEHVRHALDFILKQQEPLPAIVIDGRWDVRMRNESSRRIFGIFHKTYDMDKDRANNAMHVVFHPKGAATVHRQLDRLRRPLGPDPPSRGRPGQSHCSQTARRDPCLSRRAGRLEGTAKPAILSRDDDAVAQGRSQSRLLLDVHDVCHAARGGAAAAENRMLLSANTATAAKVRELAASTS